MKPVKQTLLRIIFLTDIHMQNDYLQALKKWYISHTNNHETFNYVFIGGDTANCNNNDSQVQKGTNQEHLSSVYKIYDFVKELFQCPLIYVPGNHDPTVFFKEHHTKRNNETNIHKKSIELVEGLDIIGMGGSLPGYIGEEKVWNGYPFDSEGELEKECQEVDFFKANFKDTTGKQLILLTHIGPQLSSTTHDRSKLSKGDISGGSKFYNSFLTRENILLWMHGHIHNAGSYDKVNKIQVVNPGPILYGQFMHMDLERSKMEGKWAVKRRVYEQLDY